MKLGDTIEFTSLSRKGDTGVIIAEYIGRNATDVIIQFDDVRTGWDWTSIPKKEVNILKDFDIKGKKGFWNCHKNILKVINSNLYKIY